METVCLMTFNSLLNPLGKVPVIEITSMCGNILFLKAPVGKRYAILASSILSNLNGLGCQNDRLKSAEDFSEWSHYYFCNIEVVKFFLAEIYYGNKKAMDKG